LKVQAFDSDIEKKVYHNVRRISFKDSSKSDSLANSSGFQSFYIYELQIFELNFLISGNEKLPAELLWKTLRRCSGNIWKSRNNIRELSFFSDSEIFMKCLTTTP